MIFFFSVFNQAMPSFHFSLLRRRFEIQKAPKRSKMRLGAKKHHPRCHPISKQSLLMYKHTLCTVTGANRQSLLKKIFFRFALESPFAHGPPAAIAAPAALWEEDSMRYFSFSSVCNDIISFLWQIVNINE